MINWLNYYIIQIQQQAGHYKHLKWHQRGAKEDMQDIWRTHEGQIVVPTLLLNILISYAHGFEHISGAIVSVSRGSHKFFPTAFVFGFQSSKHA